MAAANDPARSITSPPGGQHGITAPPKPSPWSSWGGREGSSTATTVPAASSASSSSIPTAPHLSLPKGGGAIRGIGEKFDVNLSTGEGSTTIPIRISPARGDAAQPTLALTYASGTGNGPFGIGWTLSGTHITRKTDKGLPRYHDDGPDATADVFLFSGTEDLVPVFQRGTDGAVLVSPTDGLPLLSDEVRDGYLVRRYAPRIEGSFLRIERWTVVADPADIHWRVITPGNETTLLGSTPASRIYDPSVPGRIFSWLVTETHDIKGNAIFFDYKAEDSVNVSLDAANEANRDPATRATNRYLKRVRYGNRTPSRDPRTWAPIPAAALPDTDWMFSVVLDYGEHDPGFPLPADAGSWLCRPDAFSTFRAGFEVRTYRLCRRILMFHHFPTELGVPDHLVSSTDLSYDENPLATVLVSVTQSGYTLDTASRRRYVKKSLPPVTFSYHRFPSEEELIRLVVQDVDKASLENLPIGLDGSSYQFVDLDGEGISGILTEQGGRWFYKRNMAPDTAVDSGYGSDDSDKPTTARFGDLEVLSLARPVQSVVDGQAHFGDVAGSGAVDLIALESGCWGYYERRTSDGAWESFRTFESFPSINSADRDVKFVDLTGDGLADILVDADQVYYWYPSLAGRGYGPEGEAVTQPLDEKAGPTPMFSDVEQTIYLADMSGDGLTDLVRIRNGDVCYWPNLGYGRFGGLVRMDNAPWCDNSDSFNGKRIRLADIDGSGTTDIVYLGGDGVDIYLNQSGNSFSSRKRLDSFPPIDDDSVVNVVDFLGNGTSCLVWSSSLPGAQAAPLQYLDITQGKKPYLLTQMVNNLGTDSRIHYAPSTKFYLQDKRAGTPWLTRLPFPVHCVEKMEVHDRISGNLFEHRYTYHHGFFDGVEREFRGFARVEHWDSENFAAMSRGTNMDTAWQVPPVWTKTWFHTGFYVDGGEISRHLAGEYFGAPASGDRRGMEEFQKTLLADTVLPSVPLDGDGLREACRALKGRTLRTEVYSEDGSPKAQLPYSIDEFNFAIEVLQPIQDGNLHSVFQVHDREMLSYHYERNIDDPRIQHYLTLAVNQYGQVLKDLRVAYARQPGKSPLDGPTKAKQETPKFLYSETDYTNSVNASADYRLPVPCDARLYELSGLKLPPRSSRLSISDVTANDFAAILSLTDIPFEQPNDPAKPQKRLLNRAKTLYRRDDLTSLLPVGQIQTMAIPGMHYELAFTSGLIKNVYTRQNPSEAAEYLIPSPQSILGGTGARQAGYIDLESNGSWWKPSSKASFHPIPSASPSQELEEARGHFYVPRCYTDPFGNSSFASYDSYSLFPVLATDAMGNTISMVMDYRVLQPKMLTDANGNRTAVAFDTLGMVVGTALMGKVNENLGDGFEDFTPDLTPAQLDQFFSDPRGPITSSLLGSATTRTIYDVEQYWRSATSVGVEPRPTFSAIIARENHHSDPQRPGSGGELKFQVSVAYSDGFGRVIQSKLQSKPGPLTSDGPSVSGRWIGSGWKVYNNKGDAVKQYEPFFDSTHEFRFDMKIGVSPTFMYDPLGRVVAKLRPDHGVEKTVFDAWTQRSYDVNDNVLLSDPRNDADVGQYFNGLPQQDFLPSWYGARITGQFGPDEKACATRTAAHANTPTTAHFDVLGRTVFSIVDNGPSGSPATRTDIDIEGNTRAVYDARARLVMRYDLDMGGARIHHASMDAGDRWLLYDVLGNPVYVWNSRKFQSRLVYDACRRHIEAWLRDGVGEEVLVQRNVYGETTGQGAEGRNQRGRVVQVEDQAGVSSSEEFDFKGNLVRGSLRFAVEYKRLLDWSNTVALEDATATSSYTFDALNRTVQLAYADGSVTQNVYDDTGQLDKVLVDLQAEHGSDTATWTQFIAGVDYNAKLQNTSISWGNGVTTTRTYDPSLFRLSHLKTVRPSATGPTILQDVSYVYDPVGNISQIRDDSQQTVYFRNRRVEASSSYNYDPMYRLLQATGREHLGQTNGRANAPTAPTPFDTVHAGLGHPGDGNAMGTYAESYSYDLVGNILSVAHQGSDPSNPGWTRTYAYGSDSLLEAGQKNNRLTSTAVGRATENYSYEESAGIHGNMTAMPHLQFMQWDYKDQLHATTKQIVNGGTTPETTYYVYDAGGQRVRKVTETQAAADASPSIMKERRYLGGLEIFRQYAGDDSTINLERTTLQVSDSHKRVALAEIRTQGTGQSPQRLVRYQLDNNLGSVAIELDDQARILTYEEYYPFGGTSYQASSNQTESPKRYRYTGKERDEESGLYYYGARYYAAWLGRWTAADPAGLDDGVNVYAYVSNNPINNVDPTGNWKITLSDVAKGALMAAVTIVAVAAVATVVVATGGAALAPLATAAFGASGAATAGAIATGVIGAVGVAMGAKATYDTAKEVATGKDAETGETLTDKQRSERLGALPVEALATVVGIRSLRGPRPRPPRARMVPVKVPVPQMQLVPGPNVGTAAVALDWGTAVVNVPVLAPGVAVGVASSAPSYMMGAGGGGGGGGGGEGGGGHEGGEGKPPVPETPPSEGAPTPSSPEGAAGPSPPAPPAPPAAAPPAEAGPAAKARPPRPGAQFSNNLRNWAQRHGLDLRSETTAEILNNLDITVQEFKARFRSGWTEFTTDQLKMTVREAINSGESRLRKLLINQREKFTGGKGKGRR